jgi:hypothetical protein
VEGREQIWLKEEIRTGALDRMIAKPAPRDSTVVWWDSLVGPLGDLSPGWGSD